MTDPNDFDPIADSLRRQFSPPSMHEVERRITLEAARIEQPAVRGADGRGADGRGADGRGADGRGADGRGADGRGADGRGADGRGDGRGADGRGADERPVHDAHPSRVVPLPPPESSSDWTLGLTVVLTVAAAALLVLWRPWDPSSAESNGANGTYQETASAQGVGVEGPPDPMPIAEPERMGPRDTAMPPTSSARAGMQLTAFLNRGDSFEDDGQGCAVAEPPEVCGAAQDYPQLLADGSVSQLGECGGRTASDCADFDLPADRALLVRLEPSGRRAIVCIERAWTDPHPRLPSQSGYNIFRRELGEHILYEITPLDHSQALDRIRL